MRQIHRSLFGFALLAILAAACTPELHAQYVYVNDHNGTANANTVTTFTKLNAPPTLSLTATYPTGGTGLSMLLTFRQQALYDYSASNSCLFVADPAASAGFPNGDVASYLVTNTTGVLTTPPTRYASPFGANGLAAGIGLIAGGKLLFGAYSGTHQIVIWTISPTLSSCVLDPVFTITVSGTFGGYVHDMALAPAANPAHLVVTYGDGSVQSFRIAGTTLVADCAAPTVSTGYSNHGHQSFPYAVDVTMNGQFAVFGDKSSLTELETIPVPIVCGPTTADFGGPAPFGSGISLGPGVNALNVWISPNEQFVYVSNKLSGKVTTVVCGAGCATMTGIAGGCAAGYTNPTALHALTWLYPAGLGTRLTTGNGNFLYVGEWGNPSSVALLQIGTAGCTQEVAGSPFTDPNSNYTTHGYGLTTLSALPPRPF
jgi:hypothetical protein